MKKSKRVSEMKPDEIKEEVRKAYTQVAGTNVGCGCEPGIQTSSSCCGDSSSRKITRVDLAQALGYDTEKMPISAIESFAGCGNPVALASLKEGEVVLDLGSGAGLDMLVACKKVGEHGKVIGIDMTPAMIEKAKKSAAELGITNAEFRLGDIEDMPVEDESIDIIISNCVINLAPDKSRVFREAFRVLRPGGRIMVSDIVLSKQLPREARDAIITYTGCIGGAILDEDYVALIRKAGFVNVEISGKAGDSLYGAYSAYIAARKPY